MAVTLGRNGTLTAPFGSNIISVSRTVECETIDISNRSNVGGPNGGYKVNEAGLKSVTWEIECHDPDSAINDLLQAGGTNATVMSVTENISVDGAVTFTITAKGGT